MPAAKADCSNTVWLIDFWCKVEEGTWNMSFRRLAILLAVVLQASLLGSDWRLLTPFSTQADLQSVAYGNGTYVAVGDGLLLFGKGIIIYSVDEGATWRPAATTEIPLQVVAAGDGIFVAGGTGSKIYRSGDGKSWSATDVPGVSNLVSLAFGNGVFVGAFVQSGWVTVISSRDGIDWKIVPNLIPPPEASNFPNLTFGNGKFVIAPTSTWKESFPVYFSVDGESWTPSAL